MKKTFINCRFSLFTFLFSLLVALLLPVAAGAQDRVKASVSGSLVSKYMWRGLKEGDISLQPELDLKWKGLNLNIWGDKGLDKEDHDEIDITLGYSRWGFNIGVIDYWTADVDPRNRFFFFSSGRDCPHQLEANIGYTCKYGSLQAYTMFAGNDFKIDGRRAYSTYIELSVPFRAVGLDWDVRAGISPMESAGKSYEEKVTDASGKTTTVTRGDWMYGERFTCNMVSIRATKDFEFKHLRLPVYVELHANPYLQTAHVFLGISVATL